MVSFKTVFLPLATFLVLVQGQVHKRHRFQPRHYDNYTESEGVSTTLPGTGYDSTSLLGTGYDSTTLLPNVTYTPAPSAPVSVVEECKTFYETKVVTYTLGDGKTRTTTVVNVSVFPHIISWSLTNNNRPRL